MQRRREERQDLIDELATKGVSEIERDLENGE